MYFYGPAVSVKDLEQQLADMNTRKPEQGRKEPNLTELLQKNEELRKVSRFLNLKSVLAKICVGHT